MIDFRYHLVSLISVFLALAVGITLGAGPLQSTIGTQLTGQVEQLRAAKDALRTQLDATTVVLEQRNAYIEASSGVLLADALPRSVAVVTLPGADSATVDGVIARLEQSGATVSARIGVAETWTDVAKRSFRASLVGSLAGYLDPAPAADASAEAVLGAALAQALTSAKIDDAAVLSDNANLLLEVLASGGLIDVATAPGGPAETVVVVAAAPLPAAQLATSEPDQDVSTALLGLVSALVAESQGTAVAGPANTATDLVSLVRADGTVAARVATVDTVSEISGQISVPLAVAAAAAGTIGHYGFAPSATAILPPSVGLVPLVAATPAAVG